jgi:hypothetical protein
MEINNKYKIDFKRATAYVSSTMAPSSVAAQTCTVYRFALSSQRSCCLYTQICEISQHFALAPTGCLVGSVIETHLPVQGLHEISQHFALAPTGCLVRSVIQTHLPVQGVHEDIVLAVGMLNEGQASA